MAEKQKLSKLRLMMITAALAAGAVPFGSAALAENSNVSEKDILSQAVALYEKLSGSEVEVPESLAAGLNDSSMAKAVMLGFANADELDTVSETTALRKQDAMTVLYKTIIDFDDSYALSTSEVDEIMNKCYDNALVDEQNRVGYAFMLKHGIIQAGSNTEPDKEISWESCKILVDVLYDMFMQDVSFELNGNTVTIGANIATLTKTIGEPDRIDKSDFGFDWYVYNSDYAEFMMVGVKDDRICAFFSNSAGVEFDGLKIGDDYLQTYKYTGDDSYRFFTADEATIDAVMYNPYSKVSSAAEVESAVRSAEIIDYINAYRVKNGLQELKVSPELWEKTSAMPSQAKYLELARDTRYAHTMDDATHETGFDTVSIYAHLISAQDAAVSEDVNAIGVGTVMLDNYHVFASIATDKVLKPDTLLTTAPNELAALPTPVPSELPTEEPTEEPTAEPAAETPAAETPEADTVTEGEKTTIKGGNAILSALSTAADTAASAKPIPDTPTETPSPTAAPAQPTAAAEPGASETPEATEAPTETPTPEPTAMPGSPEILSYVNESVAAAGEDVVLKLKKSVAEEYYVRIYSIEDDEYIVDSYIRTDADELSFDAELFTAGKDYTVEIGAVTKEGIAEALPFVLCYGEVPEDALQIVSPASDEPTDSDCVKLEWQSEIYHDFIIDIYDENGNILISQPVNDAQNVTLQNIDPGEYMVYVNALRRGSNDVVKAQAPVKLVIELPEPIITEYILDEGEKFYPVYEDTEMGILYFYDEDIVDVDVVDKNGKAQTVKRKKITEKQVKSTAKYRRLANTQQKVEYFEGNDTLTIQKPTVVTNAGTSATGAALVKEAEKYLGVQYVWGGTTPAGFDCSGLVQYALKSLGVEISRTTYTQVKEGVEIPRDQMQPGDLIFFANNGNVHHVGIYAGNGMMIHAPYTGTVVQYQSIETDYYKSQFYCARRVF